MTEKEYHPNDPLPETIEELDRELEHYLWCRGESLEGSISRNRIDARIAQLEYRRRQGGTQTQFDRLITLVKNNRVIATILILGVGVVAVNNAAKAAVDLKQLFVGWFVSTAESKLPDTEATSTQVSGGHTQPQGETATIAAGPSTDKLQTAKAKYEIRLSAPLGGGRLPPCSFEPGKSCLLFNTTYLDEYEPLEVHVRIMHKNGLVPLFERTGKVGDKFAFDTDPGTYDIWVDGPQFTVGSITQLTVEAGEGRYCGFEFKKVGEVRNSK